MTNNLIKSGLLFLGLSFMIGCGPKNEESGSTGVDTAAIKNEIQAKENQYAEVYNAREIRNIGYYAEDAISFSQNRAPLIGRSTIVEYLKANMDSVPQSHKISFTTNEVYISDGGNQVIEIGYYKVVDDANTIINSGNYMSLFVKRDGKYVCLRDMSTSDMPLE